MNKSQNIFNPDPAPKKPGSIMQTTLDAPAKTRILITFLSVTAYILGFIFIAKYSGRGMSMCAIVPVAVIAWLFGLLPAVIAVAMSLPANIFMYMSVDLDWANILFTHGAGIAGTIGLFIIGAIVGRFRDSSIQLSHELSERKRAEKELEKNQGQLDAVNKNLMMGIAEKDNVIQELNETKERLESLLDNSLDPIVFTDNKGRIVKPNRAFIALLGYPEEQLLGKQTYDFSITENGTYESTTGEMVTIDDDFFSQTYEKIAELHEQGKTSNWISYLKKKGNTIIPVNQNIIFLYNNNGVKTGSFGIIRDITEEKKNELELVKSKEESEAANRSKSNFLANMSHEIRTPMNGVIGFTDMLLETELDTEQRDYAQIIKRSGEALLSLINDILDFSKIEAGKIDLEELDFDIEVLTYDVCDLIRPRISNKNVELLCRIGDNLPAMVKGDPHRFRQVLVNLMGNAAKFVETGEIEISLDVESEAGEDVMVHTKVRDTGIGVPENKLDSIFDLFQQADGSTTRQYGGTGLGLSICRRIASLMGGNVWAESKQGKGSTFHFTVRLKRSEEKSFGKYTPVSLSGKKILITDDNNSNLEILTHILELAGMHVKSISNGKDTLKTIHDSFTSENPFDICVFDIVMPAMSGYELAKKIRLLYGDSLRLLAFTSSTDDGAKKCHEAGFNGYLPKPVKRIKLLKMIERLMGKTIGKEKKEGIETKIVTQYSMSEDAKHSTSILLAEDNPVNQQLAVKLLTKAGYSVDVACNGKKAVDQFTATPDKYDIIFMDIQMPELNGHEATKMLRAKGFSQIPIIAMTANAMKGDREKCLASGMNDYIPKPIKREVVFEVLRKWVIEKIKT